MAIKETLPFNYTEVFEKVKEKFVQEGYDPEISSNTMQLVSAMSYLVSSLNANTAININETLLTLARKRNTALQDARVLGYEIDHIQSYQYDITLQFDNDSTSEVTRTINKYDSFTSNGNTYYYFGENINLTIPGSGSVTETITVKEGELKSYQNEETLTFVIQEITNEDGSTEAQHYIDVPFTNVENNGIEMTITYFNEEGFLKREKWTKSTQFMIEKDTILNKEFVRLDDIDYKTPSLYFKLGDVGKELRIGTIIELTILISNGVDGEAGNEWSTSLPASIIDSELKIQGTPEESLESIKLNAPLFHNTANRVITDQDYKVFCNRQATVRYSDVWDGMEEYPKRAGYIWFSFIPSTISRSFTNFNDEGTQWDLDLDANWEDYLTNWFMEDGDIQKTDPEEEDGVFDVLDFYKVPTLRFFHRHPVYLDFEYEITIARYTATEESITNENVFNVINEYFLDTDDEDEAVEVFNYDYFQSNLIKRIDNELTDITGFDLTLTTSIHLTSKHVISEIEDEISELYYKEVRFHLGVPYKGIFENENVIFENLPDITTENFVGSDTLSVIEDDGSNVAEVSEVQTEADSSGSLNNKYWNLNSVSTKYYIWYNVNGAGTDPGITNKTPIEVGIASDATADDVAIATESEIDALSDFNVTRVTNTLTITNIEEGEAEDISDGNTGWSNFSTTIDGESNYPRTFVDGSMTIKAFDVDLGGVTVGELRTFNGTYTDIEVILYVSDTGGSSEYSTGIDLSNFDDPGLTVNISYSPNNIPMSRNTIPRLKQVKFL